MPLRCLVYLPHSYTGRGPAESCVQIIRYFRAGGVEPELHVGRVRRALPDTVTARPALSGLFKLLPWRSVQRLAMRRIDTQFRAALATGEPGIAYFWPTPDPALVAAARDAGWVTVREMTNRTLAAAKASLDEGFARAGESLPHHISEARVAAERAELPFYDLVFSSNADVDQSLRELGVEEAQILQTTFGWPDALTAPPRRAAGGTLTVGYLGTLSIGKGIPDLLDAWARFDGVGELHLAGPVDWSVEAHVNAAKQNDTRITLAGYLADVGAFFAACDVVVIPTLDEGGPQVTYEAAATGAAIIATPMARARMLEHDRNALIVPCHDPIALAAALQALAGDVALRQRLGEQAQADAQAFRYSAVGQSRAEMLRERVQALRGN
ncbi:glycosyltransferase [Erythrobacter sp. EC-HK427]|uniref:glycosyltransferase n=1 Tax=Erythrobacter sp. EC-HK427 TaxID=2038396 RepID=UPI001252EB94|nr:glycosyltransferase [Erythrobacter sp. EC-HK427]VVS98085.1 conserved hypothetical protein [Erythrobacter sp. EC-HK427]